MADTDLVRIAAPGPEEVAAVALWINDFRLILADLVKEQEAGAAELHLDQMGASVALSGLARCVSLLGFAPASSPATTTDQETPADA